MVIQSKEFADDDIVISGISGRFPKSSTYDEFAEKLFKKEYLIDGDHNRWARIAVDIPPFGFIDNLDKFDSEFFGFNSEEADFLAVQTRIALQQTYEASIDAGFSPKELNGSKTGIYYATCTKYNGICWEYFETDSYQYKITSTYQTTVLNYVAHVYNFNGPTILFDSACSSSIYALNQAVKDMQSGKCDSAIVMGYTGIFNPFESLQFSLLKMTSPTGLSSPLDENANGYARAEGAVTILLQKARSARRIYCSVVHTKTNCDGFKAEGITFPSATLQARLMEEFYQEIKMDPREVNFLEAHATGEPLSHLFEKQYRFFIGTLVGDPEECHGIDLIFCKQRNKPFLIGSVKGNMGHAEGASTLCSIAKVIAGFQAGFMPPCGSLKKIKSSIPSLAEGRIKPIMEPTKLEGPLVAISSYGFGGANGHVLLRGCTKRKVNGGVSMDGLPRLLIWAGRTKEACKAILDAVIKRPLDAEFIHLLNTPQEHNISANSMRMFALLQEDEDKANVISYEINRVKYLKRQIVWIFDGKTNWQTIDKKFFEIPPFKMTFDRCLELIVQNGYEWNDVDSSIGSIVIQMALADTLIAVGLVPDMIKGIGRGEVVAAYADRCITMEETIKVALLLSLPPKDGSVTVPSTIEQELISFLPYKIQKWSPNVTTIKNKAEMAKCLWSSRNDIENSNESFTTDCIILTTGKIGKESKTKVNWFALFDGSSNVAKFFEIIGRLFILNLTLLVNNLFPKIEYPVSVDTPNISSLIKWNEKNHMVNYYGRLQHMNSFDIVSGDQQLKISLTDDDVKYIEGHRIDGKILFPATGYLMFAWQALAKFHFIDVNQVSVEMSDLKFLRATAVPKIGTVILKILINKYTGRFEISEGSTSVVSGCIKLLKNENLTNFPLKCKSNVILQTADFYKELKLRGYHYTGDFRKVMEASADGIVGKIQWTHYAPFIDCMLQMLIIGKDSRALYVPIGIDRVVINTTLHEAALGDDDEPVVEVKASKVLNLIQAGGIEIQGLRASAIARKRPPGIPVIEKYQFVPYHLNGSIEARQAVRIFTQLALENHPEKIAKIVELDGGKLTPIVGLFLESFGDLPLITTDLKLLTDRSIDCDGVQVVNGTLKSENDCYMMILSNALNVRESLLTAKKVLKERGFLLCRETSDFKFDETISLEEFSLISTVSNREETFLLFMLRDKLSRKKPVVIKVSGSDIEFDWLKKMNQTNKSETMIVLAENEPLSGLIGLINCIQKEPKGDRVFGFLIDDPSAPPFSLDNPLYAAQIDLGLAINIYRNGEWGSYRHLLLNERLKTGPQISHFYANTQRKGDLSSFAWLQGPLNWDSDNDTLVRVVYSALNFRDVMHATGRLSEDIAMDQRHKQRCILGLEFSGVTRRGRHVMGTCLSGGLGTLIEETKLALDVPSNWTLAEAATVPTVYITVYTALFFTTRIQSGKKILIHAGTGGVGLAAIRVALAYGLEVFTTVSTEEKKRYLLETYPELSESHIGNSRDCSFYEMVMKETQGRGVDYVLNSLSEEKLRISIKCLGRGGHFLEIGKFDMANDNEIGLGHFENQITFHAILVDNIMKGKDKNNLMPVSQERILKKLNEDIQRGIVQPLKITIFPASKVEEAYRFLASAKHIGKVLLQIRENEESQESLPITTKLQVNCDPSLSYVIPGGLGGFGLELADWLVLRGCTKLVLSSSRGISKPYQKYRISIWQSYGVEVLVSTSSISTYKGCEQLIREAMTLGPVGGIFNLAVILRDSILENQDASKFRQVLAPKADATNFLDKISRQLCPQLHYFVVFSSVSCGRGNAGQTNYGKANSIMERIIERRHADGLPAKAIQWGAVGEVGLVAEMQEGKVDLVIGGTLQQRISSCLEEMDGLMTSPDPIVSSMVVAEKRANTGSGNIIDSVLNILSIRDLKSVSFDSTLSELGMDSLMAVEIRQMFERDYDVQLNPKEMRTLTLRSILGLAEKKKMTSNLVAEAESIQEIVEIPNLLSNLGDEKTITMRVLKLKTRQDDGDSILIFPGIEGAASSVWHQLASKVSRPLFMFQLGSTTRAKSFDEMAELMLPDVLKMLEGNMKTFKMVGHSFGCMQAIYVANLLEKHGFTGKLLLLDGSPKYVQRLSQAKFTSSEDLEQKLIFELLRVINMPLTDELVQMFSSKPTWHEKIHLLKELLVKYSDQKFSDEYVDLTSESFLQRMKLLLSLDLSKVPSIQSDVILIQPTVRGLRDIEDDYGLRETTKGKLQTTQLEGNHLSFLEQDDLVAYFDLFDEKFL